MTSAALPVRAGIVRAVIVEDEPIARQILREFIEELDWMTLVGEAADGAQAIEVIDRERPDLVFLDVSLPLVSGMQVLERIRCRPEIVFTTAHDQFALPAFEAGALDYLVKPFGRRRFAVTIERVFKNLTRSSASGQHPGAATRPLRRLFARTRDSIIPIETQTIESISSVGDYVEVACASGRHLLHIGLAELMQQLDPAEFFQIHRSHAISLAAIERLIPYDSRRLLVRLRSGKEIVASRSASESLRSMVR